MSEIVKKVLDIIMKLSQEDKVVILKALSENMNADAEKTEEATEATEGDAAMNPRNNPEVKDQNDLMQKFLNYGNAR